jgi:hypothetical protein
MKKSIVALSIAFSLFVGHIAYAEPLFTDLKSNHWAYKSINALVEKKVLSGYNDGRFSPENTITRAELAVILTKVAGLEVKDVIKTSYSDVKSSDWFAPYAEITRDYLGGFKSKETGTIIFAPDKIVTREDIASAIVLAKGLKAKDEKSVDIYNDARDIAPSRKNHLAAAVENNIISGYDDKTMRPKSSVTRAEAAVIIWRAFGKSDVVDENKAISVKGIKIGDTKDYLIERLGKPTDTRNIKDGCINYEYKDVDFLTRNDQVIAINVYSEAVKLSDGVGPGSTLNEVLAVYGEDNLKHQKGNMDIVYAFLNDRIAISFNFDNRAQVISDGKLRDSDIMMDILVADVSETIKQSNLYKDLEEFKSESTKLDYIKIQK